MKTLKDRLSALERATEQDKGCGYLDLPPTLSEVEWDALARVQQAELVRETGAKAALDGVNPVRQLQR